MRLNVEDMNECFALELSRSRSLSLFLTLVNINQFKSKMFYIMRYMNTTRTPVAYSARPPAHMHTLSPRSTKGTYITRI